MLNWTKGEVKKILGDELRKIIEDFRQLYSLECNIPERFLLGNWMDELINKFVDDELDNFFKTDFMFVGEGIYTSALQFVTSKYQYSSFVEDIEKMVNFDDIRFFMEEEFVLLLTNITPYNSVPSSYWYEKVRSVPSVYLLGKYKNSSLENFVLTYAEDWAQFKVES